MFFQMTRGNTLLLLRFLLFIGTIFIFYLNGSFWYSIDIEFIIKLREDCIRGSMPQRFNTCITSNLPGLTVTLIVILYILLYDKIQNYLYRNNEYEPINS